MLVLACVTGDHEVLPDPGTARRVRDGQPADLLNPAHYPVRAVCRTCGEPARIERFYLGEWRHLSSDGL
jgi:hypothetical protein